mmetsp:Transcript_17062/g.39041  ORF Transcript_17062/g.39041 Transcript_17062/m.39041 type:complete len:120 (-) Transcript_17062:437-796(-)
MPCVRRMSSYDSVFRTLAYSARATRTINTASRSHMSSNLQLECTQLLPAVMIVMALALLLRSEFHQSVRSVQSASTPPPLRESADGSARAPLLPCGVQATRLAPPLERTRALAMLHCGT